VKPGELGLIWRASDGLEKEPLKDGFYLTAPWNDVYRYDVRWQSYTEDVEAWSADNLQVTVKAAIILRPIPDDIYYLVQTVGPDYYERIVRPEFLASVRNVVAKYPVVMVPDKSATMARQIQQVVEAKLQERHLIIQSVALAEVDFPKTVKTAIELIQVKEQEKEPKGVRIPHCNQGCRNCPRTS
jgi:regulator of protease activity HflC (stomatin/prohibitin superfamily)